MPVRSRVPVAVFLSSFITGGTEQQIIELIGRLDRSRFDVRVACFHRRGPWLHRVEGLAPIAEFPISGFRTPSAVRQLGAFARWCRRHRIAVVQSSELYSNVFALPGARLGGVPVRVGSRREINPDKSFGLIGLQRLAYGSATCIVANSNAAAERLRFERVRTGRIAVIPNGIDLDRFGPRRQPPDRPPQIVMVANLRPEKGHDTLIAAAPAVVRRFPDAEFLIVGEGPLGDRLAAMVAARGLAGRFRFLGHRDDVPALLAAADLFVLPSRSEAFPNGVMEAMAASLPVVATGVGGVRELVEHGRTGLLVAPDDPGALSAAALQLLQRPAEAAALGLAARRTIESRYAFGRMVDAFGRLYLAELDARAPAWRSRMEEVA